MTYSSIKVTPITPHIGAEIGNIDLTKPLSNREVEELHQAFAEHQVIFFRNQPIDHEAHKALACHFGELHIHVGPSTESKPLPGQPEIRALHFDENSEKVAGERWHTDQSCAAIPPLGSILYLHTVPPNGGSLLCSGFCLLHASRVGPSSSPAIRVFPIVSGARGPYTPRRRVRGHVARLVPSLRAGSDGLRQG